MYQPDSEVIRKAKEKEREVLDAYERTKVRHDITISVPTNDPDVKLKLREYGEPVCLFGEDAYSRRERLKLLVSRGAMQAGAHKVAEQHKEKPELFYTSGSPELLEARKLINASSLEASRHRIAAERGTKSSPSPQTGISSYWNNQPVISCSQIGDTRPLSSIHFNPRADEIAVSSWTGDVNVFDYNLVKLHTFKGNSDRCNYFDWSPSGDRVASVGVDMRIQLFNRQSTAPDAVLEGHEAKINRVQFHPRQENFLLSTSDDETWRIWDLTTQTELLLQEGHAGGVMGVSVHPDGSLVATSDSVGVILVWDLRTGRSILPLTGHLDTVTCLDWAPDGVTLASGSTDNSVRVWDVRRRSPGRILPAHEKLVSSVQFRGDCLVTAGYDCVAKVWDSEYRIIKNLPIHETRIMGCDVSSDGKYVATCCYDRTFKVWSNEANEFRKNKIKMEIEN